jgi:hypothetical protein
VAGRIRSIEKIHVIGTRTRDLPACGIVPQPTTLPRAPPTIEVLLETRFSNRSVPRSYKEDNWGDQVSSVRESVKRGLERVKLKNHHC